MPKILEIAAVDVTINAFVMPLMGGLSKLGFEVIAAAADTGYLDKISKSGYRAYNIDFVRNLSPIGNLRAFTQLLKLLEKEKPDIIHTHTPIASALARIASKISGTPQVFYTLHGLKTQFPLLQAEKLMCRYLTDHVFITNPSYLDFINKRCRVPWKNITILGSAGINLEKFDPANVDVKHISELRGEFKLDGNTPVIGFVGRIVREKGIITLIDAFADLCERYQNTKPKLLIIGSADSNERDTKTVGYVKRKIHERKLQDNIVFTGHRSDLPELLSIMNIFALPSYIEGMCISTLEAMAMELPVVATDIHGIKEEVTPKCGILVPVGDSRALTDAMDKLLRSPAKAKKMGKNGRCRVVRHFDERVVLDAQFKVFSCFI